MILNNLLKHLIEHKSVNLSQLYELVGDLDELIDRSDENDKFFEILLLKKQRKIKKLLEVAKAMEKFGLIEKDNLSQDTWNVVFDKAYYFEHKQIKEIALKDFVIVDLEVSDLDVEKADILKISALKIENMEVKDELIIYVNNKKQYANNILEFVEIEQAKLDAGIELSNALALLQKFVEKQVVLAYHYKFDDKILQKFNVKFEKVLNLLDICKVFFPEKQNRTFMMLAKELGITQTRGFDHLIFKTYLKICKE